VLAHQQNAERTIGEPAWSALAPHGEPSPALYLGPDGSPARWNPCKPVLYSVRWKGAPASAKRDFRLALRALAAATGLRFVDTGRTPRVPQARGDLPYGSREVIVTWTDPNETAMLPRGVYGYAGSTFVWSQTGRDATVGFILFHSAGARRLRPGLGPTSVGALIVHEWGHVLGLSHSPSGSSVMYPYLNGGPGRLSAIDRRALRRLYRHDRTECVPSTTSHPNDGLEEGDAP
jgi:hypothetical protein